MIIKGVLVVTNPSDLVYEPDSTIYLLPHRLRLVRTSFGDNGFSGVRTLTSEKQFLHDLQMQAEASKMVDGEIPPELEGIGGMDMGTFAKLESGEYMTVSPGEKLKYLVCNPNHYWAALIREGMVLLHPVSEETIKTEYEGANLVQTTFASFV
jgi:hypothetical protein